MIINVLLFGIKMVMKLIYSMIQVAPLKFLLIMEIRFVTFTKKLSESKVFMVEIVFDEITRNSLRDEIVTCGVNKNNKNKESISDDILCLGYLLDLGSLNCDLYGDVRKKSLSDLICGNRDIGQLWDIGQRFSGYRNEAERIIAAALSGESIRIWNCEMAFSICGVYLLCDMLREIECDISIVDFPKEKRDVTSSFGYSHWGILKPGEYYTYLSEAKEITKMEKQRNSDIWRSLKKENSLLRVYSDGKIRSVTPDYYDKLILNILPTQNFTLKRAIGEVMKRMPVYINLGLVEKRIFHMIENGTLCINKKDQADD